MAIQRATSAEAASLPAMSAVEEATSQAADLSAWAQQGHPHGEGTGGDASVGGTEKAEVEADEDDEAQELHRRVSCECPQCGGDC